MIHPRLWWGADGWAKNQLGERRLGELFFGRQTIGRQQSFQKRRFAERRLGDKGLSSLHFVSRPIVISLKLDVITHDALDAVVLTRYPFWLVQVNALPGHTKHRKRIRCLVVSS